MKELFRGLGIPPGPWHIAPEGLGNKGRHPTVYATNEDLNYVCCVCADYATINPVDNLKNAQFISYAPEMLVALIEIVLINRLTAEHKYGDPEKAMDWGCVKTVLPVIEKSTGKSWEELKGIIGEINGIRT